MLISLILIICGIPIISSASASIPVVNTTQKTPIWKFSNPPQACPVFSDTLNLSDIPSDIRHPEIAAVGNNVYVLYKDTPNNFNFPLFFKRSTDGGASFSKEIQLAKDIFYYRSNMAAVGNNVYIVWESSSPQGIFFVRSVDSGASFEKPIKLGNSPLTFDVPAIGVYGKSSVYVAWREYISGNGEIFYARSIDSGKSFGKTIHLSNNTEDSYPPKLAISNDGNNVYVVWSDKLTQLGDTDVFFRRSSNGGTSFDNTINLSNNAGHSDDSVVITASSGAVTNNNVYVAWRQNVSPTDNEILYRRSTNGGTSFGNTINLSNDVPKSWSPEAAAFGDNHFYIAWLSSNDLLYKRSINGGTSFGNTINLSDAPGVSASFHHQITVSSNNNANVLWIGGGPGNMDVFFRKSSPGGAGFGCTLNLSDSGGTKGQIDLATGSGVKNIFTTWTDYTNGTAYLYFRTSPPPVPVP